MMVFIDVTGLLMIGAMAVLMLGSVAPNWQQKIIAVVFMATLLMPVLRWFPITLESNQSAVHTPIQTVVTESSNPVNNSMATAINKVFERPPEPTTLRFDWNGLLWWTWIVGVGVALSQQLTQILRLQAIRQRARPLVSDSHPQILISDEVAVPMLMALGRCCILLPSDTQQWPADAQQQIINHERCHHQRKDHCLLWLAVVARVVYWFHPLVHWLFKRHKTSTELACDQDLMAQGSDPISYAQALVACAHPNGIQVFNGMASQPKQVKLRLQALRQQPRRQPNRWQRATLTVMGFGLLMGCVEWQTTAWVSAQQMIVTTTQDLPSIRQHNPPPGAVHLAVFYDGLDYGQTHVRLKLANQNQQAWLSLGPLQKFNQYIHTWHLQLTPGSHFTGEYEVLGVEADGMVDGVAVGMIFTDEAGQLLALQSKGGLVGDTPNFICSWPLGLYDEELIAVLPQLTQDNPDSVRRLLCGAQLVNNGSHFLN